MGSKANPGTLVVEKNHVFLPGIKPSFFYRPADSLDTVPTAPQWLLTDKKKCILASPFFTGLLQRVSVQNEETESKCPINEIFGPKT